MLRPLLLAALLAGLAGCGVGGSGGGALPTVAASPEPMPAQPCRAESLTGTASSGAGSLTITVTNTGSRPCTLRGPLAVALVDATGATVATAAVPSPATGLRFPLTRVGNGAAAVSTLSFATTGDCHPVTGLRLTPPGDTAAVSVPASFTACGDVTVTPVAAG